MDHTQREIRNEIEATRAGMVEKIATLEGRVDESIREVKRSFDIRYQTERRPWLMVGLSAAAGYLLSGLVLGRPAPRAKVVLPKDWARQPATQQQRAGITQSLVGMLSGVVTATAVALAREYTSKLIFKRQDKANGHDPAATEPNRRYQ
jgi:hypothetical protein